MISVALFGAGRMAEAFAEQVRQSTDVVLSAVVARQSPEWIADTPCFSRLDELAAKPQVLVDFTLPAGTEQAARWCTLRGVALLSGVTGLESGQIQALDRAAQSVAVLWSPNLSLGVNLLAHLAKQASVALPADTRIHIDDVHHQHKKDAPSGTALMLGDAIQSASPHKQASYTSQRVGEVIGEHEIRFEWAGEQITLAHLAKDRAVFARGALAAAIWLAQQAAGRFSADDWLQSLAPTTDD
ncbi:MAG: dihydrodipicolinate reductase C-terminal domain-containing protein [Xanthomonadales bacterium]|nr:dihydrodipicolinate reductase C-terminal domain-containing protein [Xanthomonadales bacterium]